MANSLHCKPQKPLQKLQIISVGYSNIVFAGGGGFCIGTPTFKREESKRVSLQPLAILRFLSYRLETKQNKICALLLGLLIDCHSPKPTKTPAIIGSAFQAKGPGRRTTTPQNCSLPSSTKTVDPRFSCCSLCMRTSHSCVPESELYKYD